MARWTNTRKYATYTIQRRLQLKHLPPISWPSRCREDCFRTLFYEIFLMFFVKFKSLLVHTSSPLPKFGPCLHFISLMSGNLLNTSLTWGSDLLLPDAYQASLWTLLFDTGRSLSHIFVAPYRGAVTLIQNITETSSSFTSGTQFKYWNQEWCQLPEFGCAKLDSPLLFFGPSS